MTEQHPEHVHILQGNDVMNMLLAIYLDGFASGALSAASSLVPDAPQEQCEAFAQNIAASLSNDPLSVEALRDEIKERLTGQTDTPVRDLGVIRKPL